MMDRTVGRYGWKADLPDYRDKKFTAAAPVSLPPAVDLRGKCPPIYDQGDLGSCVGNAVAGALQFERMQQFATPNYVPSRLFIYYNARVIEGTADSDSGAEIRDGIKAIASLGAPSEDAWPYDVTQFATKPPDADYTAALQDKALEYDSLDNTVVDQLRNCLALGFPFPFGFSVYESFQSDAVASTGVVPMPGPNEGMVGGHAVLCVGYDHTSHVFLVRNSWGLEWGQGGYFSLPYDYLTNSDLASDAWRLRLIGRPSV